VPRAAIDRRLLLPGKRARRGDVERIRNLPYAGDDLVRHRLDVWRSPDAGPGAPVLLQIHGGGWMTGNKDQQARPLLYHFARRGWVCVAINYRLAPKAKWPDQLVDCKLALRWIREHVHEYGGDPDSVVATGGSAGGHLTTLVGLTANRPEYQPGFESVDTSVRAIVPLYGVYDLRDRHGFRHGGDSFPKFAQKKIIQAPPGEEAAMFTQASPIDQIHPGAPPALVVHGTHDLLAPVEEARLFATMLREVSTQPVVYVELPGAHHAFDLFHSSRGLHVVEGIDMFLTWLARHEGRVERP
jgi:acetyl esterase/lipase